ncbi:MAG: hypothetical protein QOF51_1873, partial [Chloroflexota bacterium]|nr:hypothetical protein [Chloroflexota bacterium]
MCNRIVTDSHVIHFMGTHDPAFSRTAILKHGLRQRGVTVHDWAMPAWGTTAQRVAAARRGVRNPALAQRLLHTYRQLATRIVSAPARPGVLYVGYPAQLDVLVLRALLPRARIICDAFVSLDETLADRRIGTANGPTRRAARALDRLALRLADRVVVDTRAHLRRFAADYGLRRERAVVVPVGAEDPGRLDSPMEGEGEKLRVLYFGGFIPLHGVPLIVEAARLLGPECGITIELLGDG